MNEPTLKTLDEHREYVEKMARLSFYFARCLKDKMPESTLGELVSMRTPLFYHTLEYQDYQTKWDNPDCQAIIARANELGNLPPSEFEERMFASIHDLAMERAEKFYPKSVGMPGHLPPDWNVGSLKYDPPKPNLQPNWCCFHIANALAPRSFYDDPRHLPECFMELMDRSAKEYGYDTLYTATWLNDHPRWLALFPEEWHKNLSEGKDIVGWSFGNWGQLVTARGTFNDKAGQFAREHVTLKYKARSSHCSFENMRAHLREFKSKLDTAS
jgi:hypothetical protein